MLDELAVKFTKLFYEKLLEEYDITEAFNISKQLVKLEFGDREGELLMLLKSEAQRTTEEYERSDK